MARACSLQQHPERIDIDTLIHQGVSIRRIAAIKGVTPASVQRHAAHIDTCPPCIDTPNDTDRNESIHSKTPAGKQAEDWSQPFDRLHRHLASMDARFTQLETGVGMILKYLLESKHEPRPDTEPPTLLDPPELDLQGMTPREAMRVCTQAMQQVWKRTPLKDRLALGGFVAEQLDKIARDEE